MKVENLKDLKALIKLCRQMGVDNIEVDGVKLALGTEPLRPTKLVQEPTAEQADTVYTDEQIALWSVNGQNY